VPHPNVQPSDGVAPHGGIEAKRVDAVTLHREAREFTGHDFELHVVCPSIDAADGCLECVTIRDQTLVQSRRDALARQLFAQLRHLSQEPLEQAVRRRQGTAFGAATCQPTLPSSEMAMSFCASTANSIGKCCNTSFTKPLTMSATASSAESPRCRQ